tara:strand:+ start:56 stop:355 length:300 start_codon:yes stop_codon:yes gene_type:complete
MKIIVDIDETICKTPNNRDYEKSVPIKENIEKINQLYDEGHRIVYWTARGSISGIDWTKLVHEQLNAWGAKYHEAKCGKPHYDLFICDKAINAENYFKK